MKLTSLLKLVGDGRLTFQMLWECWISAKKIKDGTEISFGTKVITAEEIMTNPVVPKIGIIVWVPTACWNDVCAQAKATKLTTQEWLDKFPGRRQINTNVLENIACPNCGYRRNFYITMTTRGEVEDDGTDANCGDHEWDEDSATRCGKCDHEGLLETFTFEGLDDLLADKQKETSDPQN